MSTLKKLNDAHSFAISVLRLGRGYIAKRSEKPKPARPIELYEFEACPYCRKAREVFSELDLDYVSRPCARGSNNRKIVESAAGKPQFPYMVDPNTGSAMYESEDIVTYLADTYGEGRGALSKLVAPLNTAGATLASAARPKGRVARPGCADRTQPPALLELWNFEASPYCRKVRETLCELNLDYLVHNVAKKSVHRPELVSKGGKMQVPYLVDANTKLSMYESEDIVAYLERTYGGG